MKVNRCDECDLEKTSWALTSKFGNCITHDAHRCKHCGALFLDPVEASEDEWSDLDDLLGSGSADV